VTDEEIYQQLTVIFRDVFCDDELQLAPELSAADVSAWDSLRHVRLLLTVERKFNRRFPASKVAELKNVGELVALIRSSPSLGR
jgi:acyl carrier protein